ncbi:major facilitator superfamily domain-containing protein [Flammula alnicola]|nr:major facilitator superfamily domain-containing protein [Flammula alnicola]
MSSRDSKHSVDIKVDNIEKIEDIENVSIPSLDAHYDAAFVRKTIRMIDWRMLPLLGLVYSLALIDRTNLGAARTAGMQEDLRLDIGNRYSIASMIYFFPYILLQIPGNIILRWMGSRTWLTICVTGWGVAQLGMAFVPTWGFLCLCRVFLGAFESGFFPSLVFIITTWYKRYEVQQRLAVFYLSSIAITSFSSILAFAITLLKGKAGLNGWQWIFLIEGLITIVLGILTWFFIPDFPDKSKFLSEKQRKMILDRVEADRGDSIPDQLTWEKLARHLKDPLLWAFAFMFLASTVPAYAIVFFITIILKGMGYSETQALLLTAPPGIFAAMSCFFFAWLSDRTRSRAVWLVVQNLICITGLALAAYSTSNPVRYFGLFLVDAGATGCIPGVLAYSSNNITSHTKRAVQTATIIAAGGVGGIMATTVFRQQDFPRYVNGLWATIGLQLFMMVLLGITTFVFKRRNRLRREGKLGPLEGQPGFYHTI